jgi:hypothetical protein
MCLSGKDRCFLEGEERVVFFLLANCHLLGTHRLPFSLPFRIMKKMYLLKIWI